MRCLTGCFGAPPKARGIGRSNDFQGPSTCSGETRFSSKETNVRRAQATVCAEQLDWTSLIPLFTGEAPLGDWWEILQGAAVALTERLPADHASIFWLAGAGVAALATSGTPLFSLRLGQLLLPSACYGSGGSSEDSSTLGVLDVDVNNLAAALHDQADPVPIVFRSTGPKQSLQGGPPSARAKSATCSTDGQVDTVADFRRHFVAVGIPGGKSSAGMMVLSATGPSVPAAWQPEGLRLVASLLSPLLRPPQVPLARRSLAELLAAATINDLVHALHGAAADLTAMTVKVALQPRVALLRSDGTAAAVFTVSDGVAGGTSVCQRRSKEVVLVDAGGSGRPFGGDFFMTAQPNTERDSMGVAGAGYKSFGEQLQRLPGGGPSGALVPGVGCRGQSLPLQNTLLSEALTRGSGLCITDCNAYVQDSKAYPRDLMLFRGTAPPQSLALATSCHGGKPLLALYATYHSILPQALLQTVVQELGQLLRALTPTVAGLLLSCGSMSDEWRHLHDDLLGPTANLHSSVRHRSGLSTAASATAAAAAAAAATRTETAAAAAAIVAEAPCTPPTAAPPPPAGAALPAALSTAATAACSITSAASAASVANSPQQQKAVLAAATPPTGGFMSHVGALFRRATTGGSIGARPGAAASLTAGSVGLGEALQQRPATREVTAEELVSVMKAAAGALTSGGDGVGGGGADVDANQRLAAFVSGGAAASGVVSDAGGVVVGVVPPVGAGLLTGPSRQAMGRTGRPSFSLEAAGSPRGGVRLAPLISTLHDRLKSAQAEQLTTSSRAASRLQDLESLRFLERVGKGGYGSVYRGMYHGSEVAIKVVEDPVSNLQLSNSVKPSGAEARGSSTTLRAKHLHDAIELVASVSMSHPNIVQLITYFVDVRTHRGGLRPATGDGMAEGPAGGLGGSDDEGVSGHMQLVHMASSGLDSTASSFTEPNYGNEAIVLVMEYCDRGSLKDAVQDGYFLHRDVLLQLQHQQGSQQQHQQGTQAGALAGRGAALLKMGSVYSTLLEIALALRHMHGLHMVHCDLKPQNVLLKSSPRDPRGFTAKLSDFGLAKMMAHDDEGQLVISDGIQSGTITHLPPEALQGRRQLGPAVDVYAFGIVMFQVLCGMTVYRGMEVKQMIRGVVRHALRPKFPAWVPAEYRELAQRCWHEQPSCRPDSLQLVAELEAMLWACESPGWPLGQRATGGSIGSVRSGIAGGAAAAAAAASHRRLPTRCAMETAIQGHRSPLSPAGGGGTGALDCAGGRARAATAAAAAPPPPPADGAGGTPLFTKTPSYTYRAPHQLYHPSGTDVRVPVSPRAAGNGRGAVQAAPPPPPPALGPTAGSSVRGPPPSGSGGGGGRTHKAPYVPRGASVLMAPPALPLPHSLYNRPATAAAGRPAAWPAAGAALTAPGAANGVAASDVV